MILSGIYKITSLSHPEREYIGSAVNIYKRWYDHATGLRTNKHGNQRLQNHANKYGVNDLTFSIVICCMPIELIDAEQYFIDAINPFFNICRTAGNRLNCRHTEATKEKLRQANLGKKQSAETIAKKSQSLMGKTKGKIISEEQRRKMSIAGKGRKVSAETRAKISIANTGNKRNPLSEEHKRKMSAKLKGQKRSEEFCKKISLSLMGNQRTKGRVILEEEKERRRIAAPCSFPNRKSRKGIKFSDEFRQKIRDSWIIRKQNKIA